MVLLQCPYCKVDVDLDDAAFGLFSCPDCLGEFEWGHDSLSSVASQEHVSFFPLSHHRLVLVHSPRLRPGWRLCWCIVVDGVSCVYPCSCLDFAGVFTIHRLCCGSPNQTVAIDGPTHWNPKRIVGKLDLKLLGGYRLGLMHPTLGQGKREGIGVGDRRRRPVRFSALCSISHVW